LALVSTGDGMLFFLVPLDSNLSSLCKVDEEENGGLRGLAEVLLNYGERHFENGGSKGARTGLWAAVLLTCGEFERVSYFTCALPGHVLINHLRPLPHSGTNWKQRSRQFT